MWIVTAAVPRRAAAVFWALAALIGCCTLSLALGRAQPAAAPLPDGTRLRSSGDRAAYLAACGRPVDPEPLSVQELIVPEAPDGAYQAYLALQQRQGFDLAAYQGKRVVRYTYAVRGAPGLRAELLLRRGRVVGGSVYSTGPGGQISGLLAP